MSRLGGLCLALLALALTAGCAAPSAQYRDLPPAEEAATPEVELEEVPFHPQEAYHCGPAALATVLEHAGVDTNPDQLADALYIPERYGTLQTELVTATRRHDHVPYPLEPSLSDLMQEVAAGNPVLVLQNLGLGFWPYWHYAVVVGYDLAEDEVILRSGTTQREVRSLRYFERTWALADHWAIVITPPDRLPATADADTWLEAVAALEDRDQLDTAHTAYVTATHEWPEHHVAWFGRGNTAYARDDFTAAADHFRRATEIAPENAAAFHNLAWALARQERWEDALAAARRSEALAPDHPVYGEAVSRLPQKH